MKISKKFKDFYNLVLATFVRANFNYKSSKFKKLYSFNPGMFFNDSVSNELMINGIFERDELDLLSNIIDKEIFIDIGAYIGKSHIIF